MNVTDFRRVLDERSTDAAEQVVHHQRLHGVRVKVIARRRRRLAAWTAAVVIALAGVVTVAVLPGLGTHVDPTPVQPPPTIRTMEGFPEYADGARVVAAKSARLPATRIELTAVVSTPTVHVFRRCPTDDPNTLVEAEFAIEGRRFAFGSCGRAGEIVSFKLTTVAGAKVGEPFTMVMTLTGAKHWDGRDNVDVPIPATGTFALAVGEEVPFTAYPLPPRPSGTLGPLDTALPGGCTEELCPGSIIIRSDPARSARPVLRTVTWTGATQLDVAAQAPGILHIRVNGVEVMTAQYWDYGGKTNASGDLSGDWLRSHGLDLHTGESVTIEVVPEYVNDGRWQVVFTPPLGQPE